MKRLKNRGPVALSPDNPYLAANMFLAEEAQNSDVIKGFITHRTAPPAIEVLGDVFNELTVKLFYPGEREYFIAEEEKGSWIVSGPHRIREEIMTTVTEVTGGNTSPAMLKISDKLDATSMSSSTPIAKLPTDLKPSDPAKDPFTKKLKASSKPMKTNTSQKHSKKVASTSSKVSKPKNASRTLAIERVRSRDEGLKAEMTPKGDLVHYVTMPGENLKAIAEWYTDDPANSARLGRINRIKSKISVGDMIIIPSYLVTYSGRLTQDALAALQR